MTKKVDLKKEFREYFQPKTGKPEIVDLPKFKYLMIDGEGHTGSEIFSESIQSLFAVSYKTKFIMKKTRNFDYVVMPLEGLWWADDMNDFVSGNKNQWKWTLMIMQPDKVKQDTIELAIKESLEKVDKKTLDLLRLEEYTEGKSAQLMHIGPYTEEHENIMNIHKHIEDIGGYFDGHGQKHHEIYLSDFRKVAPEKLKTILRQSFSMG